jgi:cell division protein FtsQ
MTTLDADVVRLRKAVERYPVVAGLRVSTDFPHRMRIRVIERVPVGTVTVDGRATAVSADGMLLPGIGTGPALPVLALAGTPRGSRVAAADGRQEVALLAAAPPSLIPRLSQVRIDPVRGLSAQVRNGPALYFGDAARLAAKWIAASEVLGDPGSVGAAYIDVTDPHRPAAGIGNDAGGSTPTAQTSQTGSTASSRSGAATSQSGAATSQSGPAASTQATSASSGPGSP